MPRNIPRTVRLGNTSTQQSQQANLVRQPKRRYRPEPMVTRKLYSRVPPPQIERIKQRHIIGQSQREIARAEGRSRPTIARIIKGEEMQAYVQEMRERFYGLAPDALAAIEYALQEQRDAGIALEVLRDIGVRPRKGESLQLPETTPQNGYSRQAIMIANVLLEGREHMGLNLEPEIEEALADLEESTEATRGGEKLPRR
jgi:transcriptional regulator with XRE-family HTH domain